MTQRTVAIGVALLLALPVVLYSQGGTPLVPGKQCFYDASGNSLSGGSLRIDLAGTSTLATVYADQALGTPLTNPVTLDGSGCATIFLTADNSYKQTLKNVAGATQWTVDGVAALAPFNVSLVKDYLRDVTQVEVVNTVATTDVFNEAVAAGTLSTNRKLRLTMIGDVLNNTGSNQTLRVTVAYGATTVADTSSMSIATSASRRPVWLEAEIDAANSATAQYSRGQVFVGAAGDVGGTLGAAAFHVSGINNAMAENSAGILTLKVSIVLGTASGNLSFRCHTVHVELVN